MANKVDGVAQAITLSTIAEKAADRYNRGIVYAIVDALADCRADGSDEASVSVGFGTVSLRYEDGSIKWRFEPSKALEEGCVEAAIHKRNLLSEDLGRALSERLRNIYKDLM